MNRMISECWPDFKHLLRDYDVWFDKNNPRNAGIVDKKAFMSYLVNLPTQSHKKVK